MTAALTPERIAELRALVAAATPGPWWYGISCDPQAGPVPFNYTGPGYYENPAIHGATSEVVGCDEYNVFSGKEDAQFIATFNPAFCKKLLDLWEATEKIASLDPSTDSEEGYNEWGEADCFGQAQKIAKAALAALEEKQG